MADKAQARAEAETLRLPAVPRVSPRQWLGLAICAAGLGVVVAEVFTRVLASDPRMLGAWQGGITAALATALGTLPVLFAQNISRRATDTLLGFGAGVMLAASVFSLMLPAMDAAAAQGLSAHASVAGVGTAVLLGALLLLLLDRSVPHEHFLKGLEGPEARARRRAWLFVTAIALHNLPEGLAIGVAFAGNDLASARSLATGIALQDVPEGLVVALALRGTGYSRGFSALLGTLSGLTEPLAALVGVALVGLSAPLLPWALAGAAGAMLYVVSHEVIPESHRMGHETFATAGLMLGFVLMMYLDVALA